MFLLVYRYVINQNQTCRLTFKRWLIAGSVWFIFANKVIAGEAIVLAFAKGIPSPAPVFSVVDKKIYPINLITKHPLNYARPIPEQNSLLKGPRVFRELNNPLEGACPNGVRVRFNHVYWEIMNGSFKLLQPASLSFDVIQGQQNFYENLCPLMSINDVQGMKYTAHISYDFQTRPNGPISANVPFVVEPYIAGKNAAEDELLQNDIFPQVLIGWLAEYDARAAKLWDIMRAPKLREKSRSLERVKVLLQQQFILSNLGIEVSNRKTSSGVLLKIEKVFSSTSRKDFLGYVISSKVDSRKWVDFVKVGADIYPEFQAFVKPLSNSSFAVLPRFNWGWSVNGNEEGMWSTGFNYVVVGNRVFFMNKEYIRNEASYWIVDELVGRKFIRRANSGLISTRARQAIKSDVH